MQLSELWLRELSGVENAISTLKDQLTSAGLEVEGVVPVAQNFSGVVVGYVEAKSPHPDADRLNVCTVDIGLPDKLQIVCGAKNVDQGQKVPVALIGAKLPGDFEIKKAKLRGVESSGMICSPKELGCEENGVEGIWVLPEAAPIGQDFREYFLLNDHLITLGITPNRGDCLSMIGVAREVAAANGRKFEFPQIPQVQAAIPEVMPVEITASEACPLYISRVIRGMAKDAKSPDWLIERLRRCGTKSIHPAVDVTNYVMHFLGQPMHAFDLSKIQGSLKVELASAEPVKSANSIVLLDGSSKKIHPKTLLISDSERPLALAGIIGGMEASVTSETVDIVFEAAHFIPAAIAGFPRKYGVNSEASHRFERGVDPSLPEKAIELATELLLSIGGGQAGPLSIKGSASPRKKTISVNLNRIKKRLGIPHLEMPWVLKTLDRIGLTSQEKDAENLQVSIPSHRFDLELEEDISEEIVRLYGLNHIEAVLPVAHFVGDELSESVQTDQALVSFLVSRGLMQTIHYSFTDPKWQKIFYPSVNSPVLKNPIASDLAQMRGSLLPGLVSSAVHNLNRQVNRVHFFELGRVFLDETTEENRLAFIKVGLRDQSHWSGTQNVDFFDLKGDLEALFAFCQVTVSFAPLTELPYLHPNQSAEILFQGQRLGMVGALHPALQKEMGIKSPVFVAEFKADPLLNSSIPTFKEISKYPSIQRDLALVLDREVSAGDVMDACKATLGSLLTSVHVFDVYMGKNIEPDKKSLALSLTLQDLTKTLVEEEVTQAISSVLKVLETKFKAKLRE